MEKIIIRTLFSNAYLFQRFQTRQIVSTRKISKRVHSNVLEDDVAPRTTPFANYKR